MGDSLKFWWVFGEILINFCQSILSNQSIALISDSKIEFLIQTQIFISKVIQRMVVFVGLWAVELEINVVVYHLILFLLDLWSRGKRLRFSSNFVQNRTSFLILLTFEQTRNLFATRGQFWQQHTIIERSLLQNSLKVWQYFPYICDQEFFLLLSIASKDFDAIFKRFFKSSHALLQIFRSQRSQILQTLVIRSSSLQHNVQLLPKKIVHFKKNFQLIWNVGGLNNNTA